MRVVLAILTAFTLLNFAPAFGAARATGNALGDSTVIVAVLDTGIRPTHQEFSYVSSTSTTDQFVGWWDFTTDSAAAHLPTPGQTWDTVVTTPYDNHGHGTGTASMAVGANVAGSGKSPSFCPGCKLAVGKVLDGSGSGALDGIAAAIEWAVQDVHADVISMSLGGAIGGVGPAPGALDTVDEAIRDARDAGVLVLVAAGNGYLNAGIAGMWSEFYPESFSTHALVVGGLTDDASWAPLSTFSMDPEVTAHGINVKTAYRTSNSAYTTWSGTSFATPQVAGMAAALLKTAIANGCSATPAYLETVLKFGSSDQGFPYALQGYGFLGATEFNALNTTTVPACAIPTRPAADVNRIYDENVAQNLRFASSDVADSEGDHHWVLTGAAASTGQGVLGPSVPIGLSEVELWGLAASAGDTITIDVAFGATLVSDGVNDFDVYLLAPGSGPVILGTDAVDHSAHGGGVTESISFRATQTGTYRVLVAGWSIGEDQPYTISATVGGSPATPGFLTEEIALGVNGPL